MSITILPGKRFCGSVAAPPSKSFLQRAIFCSAFSDKPTIIRNFYASEDISASLDFVKELGADVYLIGSELKIAPIDVSALNRAKTYDFYIKESGFVLRCAIAVCAALGLSANIYTGEMLLNRPIDDLISSLSSAGAKIEKTRFGFTLGCKANFGEMSVDASKSSQFLSALMIASAASRNNSVIKLKGALSSKGYIQITRQVMDEFGVTVSVKDNCFAVPGKNGFVSPGVYYAEGDWSSAAMLLSFGLLYGDVTVTGLNPESVQPDRKIISIVKSAGGFIEEKPCLYEKKGTSVSSCDNNSTAYSAFRAVESRLLWFNTDVDECVDLFPTIAVLGTFAKNVCIIDGVKRVQYKESDRLAAMCKIIKDAGGQACISDDKITIFPFEKKFGVFGNTSDHRIAMAAILLACEAGGEISDENVLSKSFPNFPEIFKLLGGDFSVT